MIDALRDLQTVTAEAAGAGAGTVTLPLKTAQTLESALATAIRLAGAIVDSANAVHRDACDLAKTARPIVPEQASPWSALAPLTLKEIVYYLDIGAEQWWAVDKDTRPKIAEFVLAELAGRYDSIEAAMANAPDWLPSWTSLYRYYGARWNDLKEVSK